MTSVKSIVLVFALLNLSAATPCDAPLNAWGSVCTSAIPLAGQAGTYINYMISVAGASNVYCRAVGMGNYDARPVCFWGWHDLGLVNPKYVTLIWDTNNSYPSIQCYATPTAAKVDWSFSTGQSTNSCLRSNNPFANKVSLEPESTVGTLFA